MYGGPRPGLKGGADGAPGRPVARLPERSLSGVPPLPAPAHRAVVLPVLPLSDRRQPVLAQPAIRQQLPRRRLPQREAGTGRGWSWRPWGCWPFPAG